MLKHIYFLHPDTIFHDEQTDIPNSVYCGLYEVTQDQISFGHLAKPGEPIQIDEGKKTRYLAENPPSLTPRQARLALNHFGLRESVETAIASADQNTKDEWEFANEILRNWQALIDMSTVIGITSEQLDELFRYGAKL